MSHPTHSSSRPEQISSFFREQQPSAHGASTNSLNPSSDPVLSLRAKANQTSRSPQLAFAAAIVAASLQLFTLPGLTIESQQNPTQLENSSNTEIMYAQSNPSTLNSGNTNDLDQFIKYANFLIGLFSLCLIFKEVLGLKNKIDVIQQENNGLNGKLIEAEDQREKANQKIVEIANILSK